MAIKIYPVNDQFAAEIGDVDLSKPLSDEDQQAIKHAFWKYGVLVFPDQQLTHEQHIGFATLFGPLEVSIKAGRTDSGKLRIREDLADVSNLDHNNQPWGEKSRQRMFQLGNRLWHTDSSFRHVPAGASLLYGRTIAPIGGHTEFADQRAAYDALPDAMKARLDGLIAEHCIAYSRRKTGFDIFTADEAKRLPPVPQALVRTVPESGRKTLFIASHIGRIFGLPDDEAARLVAELTAHVTQRQFVYTHRWRPRDLVMWDNRCTLHRGTSFDDLRWVRDMRRATVSDCANSCVQEGLALPA